jgi:dicarboxylate/amino acid:cation (Na+ or H+) symporter, DAACS family
VSDISTNRGTPRRFEKLHAWMLGGLLFGALTGALAHAAGAGSPWLSGLIRYVTQPVGQIFLRLLFMLVVPLIVSGLSLGVAGLGDLRSLGRIGLKTLAYTVLVSSIAVLLGITLVNVFHPGTGVPAETRALLLQGAGERAKSLVTAAPPKTGIEFLVQLVPSNPVRAAGEGDFLALMVFSLFLGVGLTLTQTPAARQLEHVLQGLYDVTMRLIEIVISVAPVAVAALVFTLTAQLGYAVLGYLAKYVGVVLLGLALHQFVVYSLTVKFLGGMSPIAFFRNSTEAMITAFSTASSNATLPTALRVAEEELRLPRHVSRFVLTIGSTANQNGTALFEGVTVLFLAQFYGVSLGLGEQAMVVLICILGGIGTAGIPAGSLPVVAMILGMVGVPVEGIGVILGVDRLLDMCRTTLNVTGDLAAAVVVARGEKDLTQTA